MKLRLHGNQLRLRVSQSEVARLAETGTVEETVTFAPGQTLSYTLEASPATAVAAVFEGGRIRVTLPLPDVTHWIESDQVGIQGSSGPLGVLVEKDFQCLHRASPEDADSFPNPLVKSSLD